MKTKRSCDWAASMKASFEIGRELRSDVITNAGVAGRAPRRHSRTAGVVAEHLLIALAVITITYVLGRRVGATVG